MTQKIESRYWDPVLLRGGVREVDRGRFGPDVLQEFALDYLARHRHEPFLLYYPMVLTHGQTHLQPVVPTPLNLEPDRPHHEMYGEMVEYADRLIGQVVAKLDELGIRDNTYLFVATDNGTEHTLSASCRGKPVHGGLYELTEAGGDVGLVANCPARIPGGRTIPLADFSDVLPTLCELAGIRQPGDRLIDGKSQAAALVDPSAKPPREWIFNQYGDRRCVRDRQYKHYSTGELYDVENDRDETTNIAGYGEPAIVAEGQKLAAILASMPPDAPPPFTLRSQSAFKLRSAAKQP
jgi:arylsulfatase A